MSCFSKFIFILISVLLSAIIGRARPGFLQNQKRSGILKFNLLFEYCSTLNAGIELTTCVFGFRSPES